MANRYNWNDTYVINYIFQITYNLLKNRPYVDLNKLARISKVRQLIWIDKKLNRKRQRKFLKAMYNRLRVETTLDKAPVLLVVIFKDQLVYTNQQLDRRCKRIILQEGYNFDVRVYKHVVPHEKVTQYAATEETMQDIVQIATMYLEIHYSLRHEQLKRQVKRHTKSD